MCTGEIHNFWWGFLFLILILLKIFEEISFTKSEDAPLLLNDLLVSLDLSKLCWQHFRGDEDITVFPTSCQQYLSTSPKDDS